REPARLKRVEEIRDGCAVCDSGKRAVLSSKTDARVQHHGHQEPSLALREAERPDGVDAVAEGRRRWPFGYRDGRLHTNSSANPGSKRLPRPVLPPARAPMPRNRVKPARTFPAAWAPR